MPGIASDLFAGHGPVLWVFFRAAAVPQELRSPDADMGTPLVCGECEIVAVEDVDDVEAIEEEEFAR